MKTNRREFIGSAGLGAAGILLNDKLVRSDSENLTGPALQPIGAGNPRDVKINVKVVFYALIHSGMWQGPCRQTVGIGSDAERVQYRKQFDDYIQKLKSNLSQDVKLLEPAYLEFPEFYHIQRYDLLKLEADKDEVYLYVVTGTNLAQYIASIIGDIYKKPVACVGPYAVRETTSYLRSKGLEGYNVIDYGGLDKLFSLLRARKAFQQTNMLLITDFGIPGATMPGSVRDFNDLKNRFGINTTFIPNKELDEERDRIMKSSDSMAAVAKITDGLIKNAQGVHMDRKILNDGSVLFYYTIKNLMNKYNCNAFSIECFELCATRRPDNWKFTPCLTHSLLKDEGYTSGCEGDINALLTEDLFMAINRKTAYMGNMELRGGWTDVRWVKGADAKGVKLTIGHDVPGLKMLGFDKPDLQYEIRNFIDASPIVPGWGGTLKIDFSAIDEKKVTIGRFNPLANKILVTKAELIGTAGFDSIGCSLGAILNVQDPVGFYAKSADFGQHFVMTYGDITKDLIQVAKMLNIELELHNIIMQSQSSIIRIGLS